jgi:hypothetical protein
MPSPRIEETPQRTRGEDRARGYLPLTDYAIEPSHAHRLDDLPNDRRRYEIVEGELTKLPLFTL